MLGLTLLGLELVTPDNDVVGSGLFVMVTSDNVAVTPARVLSLEDVPLDNDSLSPVSLPDMWFWYDASLVSFVTPANVLVTPLRSNEALFLQD